MFTKWTLLLLCLGALQVQSQAAVYQLGHLQVGEVRAAPTPPNATVAAVYLWIHNGGGQPDSLISIASPVAAKAEIHRSSMVQGVMQMRPAGPVELPAGQTIKIEPGALHIMLQGLTRPLTPGGSFALTLQFRDAGMLVVQVPVKAVE